MPEQANISSPRLDKLSESVTELLETEKTYVDRLMTTYKIYVVEAQDILTNNDRQQIFSNIEEIMISNDNLLQDLLAHCNNETGEGIGKIFLKHIPKLSVYLVYCKNQTSSIKFLQRKLKCDETLEKYIRDSLARPECHGLDLASFLLEPVQRLTRYPMLLKQIQKFTEISSEECNILAVAIEECQELIERVNKAMLEGEEFEKVAQLQRRLSSHGKFSANVITDGKLPSSLNGLTRNYGERKVLKNGIWTKLRSRRKLLVFLFSDFLLLTESASGETSLDILGSEEERLKIYRKAIHLDDIWLIKEAEPLKVPTQFQNLPNLRALEIEAHDSQPLLVHVPGDEFDDWVQSIYDAKRMLKSNVEFQTVSSDIKGTLRVTIESANSLPLKNDDEVQFCVVLSSTFQQNRFSTNPSRGPMPVWNQTFTIPLKSFSTNIRLQLIKYEQFKIEDVYCEFLLDLDFLEAAISSNSGVIRKDFSLQSSTQTNLNLKIEYISKI